MRPTARRRTLARWLPTLILTLLPAPTFAQLAPIGVPAGTVRVELDGTLSSFDNRWLDGHREGYAADLVSPALGADRIPALATTNALLLGITGDPASSLNLGAVSADAEGERSAGTIGLSLGLSNRLTLFGRIPLVRSRVQTHLEFDQTGNAGLAPGADEQTAFFQQFDAALTALGARISAGDYNADPAALALAQQTLAGASSLRNDLFTLLADPTTASAFLPTAESPAGSAVTSRITSLQGTLAGPLGVGGFTLAPALAPSALSRDELIGYLGTGGTAGFRLDGDPVTFRGDAEAGAAFTLVDRWDRGAQPGGFRVAIEALVRFPTGIRERSDRLLDLGTGDGQTDIDVRLTTDVGSGKIGARFQGGYSRRLASDIVTRLSTPSQPFVGLERLTVVTRDPGDVFALGAQPFYRLAKTLALQASAQWWSRGSDSYAYATPVDEIPGIDAAIAGEDSKATAIAIGGGITYANLGALRTGGSGLPIEASWTYDRILRATGGRVPDAGTMRMRFRVYTRLWGK